VLNIFTGSDGAYPPAGLIAHAAGNLYGTTYAAVPIRGPHPHHPRACARETRSDTAQSEAICIETGPPRP
jgi:hypothetical protein